MRTYSIEGAYGEGEGVYMGDLVVMVVGWESHGTRRVMTARS